MRLPKIRPAEIALGLVLTLACQEPRADVVAVVSAKSPITTLSKSEVADLFLGRATRFPDGGRAEPIDQSEGTRVRDEFYATFTGKSPAQVKSYWSKIIFTGRGQPPRMVTSDAEVRKVLAANPLAIAYLERSSVDSTLKILTEP